MHGFAGWPFGLALPVGALLTAALALAASDVQARSLAEVQQSGEIRFCVSPYGPVIGNLEPADCLGESCQFQGPVRGLTEAFARSLGENIKARQFAAGELSVQRQDGEPAASAAAPLVPIKSRDEIGELAGAFNQMAVDISDLLAKVRRQNAAFERFVPTEFLHHLGKQAVEDIGLGEVSRKDLSVLFSDIRNFTGLSETMTPEENFRFLNTYLTYIGPIIEQHGGFIDKYVGDAIMALFAGDKHGVADDAVEAAVGIAGQLARYNQDLARQGRAPMAAGIGLHTGTLMLGTIGFERRMDSTVIGDTVNLAARMEGLTKQYATPIAISETTYRHLRDPAAFLIREVDTVQVKGRAPARRTAAKTQRRPGHVDLYRALRAVHRPAPGRDLGRGDGAGGEIAAAGPEVESACKRA